MVEGQKTDMGMLAWEAHGGQPKVRHRGGEYQVTFDPAEFQTGHDRSIDGISAILSEMESEEFTDPPSVYDLIDSDALEYLIAHHYEISEMAGVLEIDRTTEACRLSVRCAPESVSFRIEQFE